MEGNVRDGNQQPMAKRSEELLLGVESVWGGGCGGAGGASERGVGTRGACWNLHSSGNNSEEEEEEELCFFTCVPSLAHIWSMSESWAQLGPKKCFTSRVLGLRLVFVLLHCPQQDSAGVLGTRTNP